MAIKSEYTKNLVLTDFTMATSVAVATDGYTELGYFRIPVDNVYFPGNGKINLGVDDRGTFKAAFKSAGGAATLAGNYRLRIFDSNRINSKFIREDLATDAGTGVKMGRGGQTGNEKQLLAAGQYAYLVVEAKADTAITVTAADSTMQFPVSIQAL